MEAPAVVWGVWKAVLAHPYAVFIGTAVATMITYLFPVEGTRQLALVMIYILVLDTGTGVVAAKCRGESITSRAFRKCLLKMGAYASAVVAVVLMGKTLPGLPVVPGFGVSVAFGLAIITEGISVLENARDMLRANGNSTEWIDRLIGAGRAAFDSIGPKTGKVQAAEDREADTTAEVK